MPPANAVDAADAVSEVPSQAGGRPTTATSERAGDTADGRKAATPAAAERTLADRGPTVTAERARGANQAGATQRHPRLRASE
ncbi:hypothetical protein [Rhodococcus globerulus]|uniref:hypothetical protein n=1 Tax=Rhodococcus globerulus TaxID=33008 RepID=UPI000B8296E7|nr:hypothetical protein [Rhodococcus globerulus]